MHFIFLNLCCPAWHRFFCAIQLQYLHHVVKSLCLVHSGRRAELPELIRCVLIDAKIGLSDFSHSFSSLSYLWLFYPQNSTPRRFCQVVIHMLYVVIVVYNNIFFEFFLKIIHSYDIIITSLNKIRTKPVSMIDTGFVLILFTFFSAFQKKANALCAL